MLTEHHHQPGMFDPGHCRDCARETDLLALLLTESRRASRTRPDGSLVLLGEQDRTQWDQALITEGQTILRRRLRRRTTPAPISSRRPSTPCTPTP